MSQPLIVLSGGGAADRQFHEKAAVLSKTYSSAVIAGGGVPLLVTDSGTPEDYAALADGLILTGSASFAPEGELREIARRYELEERDDFDASLARAFANAGKPVFGICLGIQTLNKAFGGTLEEMFKKRTKVEHLFREHLCLTTEGSVTRSLFGDTFPINSRHQICVDRVAEGFIVTALSPDGIVEEMRHETLPIYGFQYHPERMRGEYPEPPDGPDMTRLFAWFVEQCKKGRKRNETD